MSSHLHHFEAAGRAATVALPFALDEVIGQWESLRLAMVRQVRPEFSRDEWAYLMAFLDGENLRSVFATTFGQRVSNAGPHERSFFRPRGPVAVWLPNNVSLLGPLTLILLSLSGNPLRLKGGSGSDDLTGAFLEFAREAAPVGELKNHLATQVSHEVFGRDDPRHLEFAASAQVRIVCGSDAAAEAILGLPHPLESSGFSFVDRRSEAWLEKSALTDALLGDVIKVFAIYGQAGCTSPRRLVLLDASPAEVVALRDRLLASWPQVIKRLPAMHIASGNILSRQSAAALGWDARLAENHAAVLAAGAMDLPEFPGHMSLMITGGTVAEALESMPSNIQTLGCGFENADDARWMELLAHSPVKRMVSVGRMHHFGPVWDGQAFWRQTFHEIEIG
jgi:hypothetical protein